MKFLVPDKLQKNDEVRIISSARFIDKQELNLAEKKLEEWGLKVTYGANLKKKHHQFAGTVSERTSDFQNAINDPNVKAILFARGGYGTVKVIDNLDFKPLITNSKWMIGYSDITVVHNHLHSNCQIASLHASMPISFKNNTKEAINSIKESLMNGHYEITSHPSNYNRLGSAKGPVIGGNLSIIYSLIGSDSDIDTEGKILFIEDLDEYLYHIDRMMMNLKRSGKLSGLKGLIVGGFTSLHDNDTPYGQNVYEIIKEAVSTYSYPVLFDFPSGHIDDNRAIIFGVESNLNVRAAGGLLTQLY